MNCPNCDSETTVAKSVRFDDSVIRQRKCQGCGFSGRTDETWARSISGQDKRRPGQRPPPIARNQPPAATNSRGGVGGGLPSGLGSVSSGSDRSGSLSNPDGDSDQDPDRAQVGLPEAPYTPPRPPIRVDSFAAATSAHFDRVYMAYPRRDARKRAGEAFWLLAQTHPGGEAALADEILAAFPSMLKRHPYNGPNATRPFLDKVLAERRWEDPESAPDAPPKADARCNLHRQAGTFRQLPRGGPVPGCPTCKENAAARGTRESTPTEVAAALPTFKPATAWTPEQLAEAEALRRDTTPLAARAR